ncbi:hypothetical protein Pmani_025455 [Petrolisthes manimaculis]|uniref:BHLH domain-containing protein n=1 Tax=Petrolisthes manimaculis TaxID=1843537 RepID=A0AAE1P644_9EUCA|nr:hypothetical protein Pmani_025455 [Petrolisthes manimaculis]
MEATETHPGRDNKTFTDTNNNNNNNNNGGETNSNKNNNRHNNNNNINSSSSSSSRSEEKYGLRPRTIIKRLQQERTKQDVPMKRPPTKSKSRPAPLSKYRRKTANARERHRMREINNAFESLRRVLPEAAEVKASTSTITKIMTLRLAVEYIKALSYVLKDDAHTDLSSLESSLHDSIQSSLLQSCLQHHHHSLQQHHLQKTLPSQHQGASYTHHQRPLQMLGHCATPDLVSASSSPSTVRGSVSSTSDLEELLSDDSGLLEETFDVFHDLPVLTSADPFDILLAAERDSLAFPAELCN